MNGRLKSLIKKIQVFRNKKNTLNVLNLATSKVCSPVAALHIYTYAYITQTGYLFCFFVHVLFCKYFPRVLLAKYSNHHGCVTQIYMNIMSQSVLFHSVIFSLFRKYLQGYSDFTNILYYEILLRLYILAASNVYITESMIYESKVTISLESI